jgi:hypothetical protein
MMNDYEIYLPYHKQGCDLAHCIQQSASVESAFDLHIQILLDAVDKLISIRSVIACTEGIEIVADNHFISIRGPEEVMSELHAKGLVERADNKDDDDYVEEANTFSNN